MVNCTRCNHPDHAHLNTAIGWYQGQCQYWIIKKESDFYPTDEFGKNVKAWTQEVEYEGQCSCKGFTTKKLTRERKTVSLDTFC